MAASRRTRRRREQKSLQRHQLRLEGLEKRYALNAAPALDPAASPQLNSVIKDTGAPVGQVGTLVSDLIDAGGTHNNFSDADGDLPAIAITETSTQGGTLYYSTDDGVTWADVGAVSGHSARMLYADASTRLAFQPLVDFSGAINDLFTFKSWDRSDGHANGATVEITNPTNGRVIGSLAISGSEAIESSLLSANEEHVYIASEETFFSIDVTTQASPAVVGQLSLPQSSDSSATESQDVVFGGPMMSSANSNYIYTSTSDSLLQVIDLSDPTNPQLSNELQIDYPVLSYLSGPGNVWAYSDDMKYGYISAGERLWFIDLSVPENPRIPDVRTNDSFGRFYLTDGMSSPRGLISGVDAGNNLTGYVTTTEGFQVVDLNPMNDPRLDPFIGMYADSEDPNATYTYRVLEISAESNHAYVGFEKRITGSMPWSSTTTGFHVIDFSEPTNPTLTSTFEIESDGAVGSYPHQLIAKNGFVYVKYPHDIQIVDVSDPTDPVLVADFENLFNTNFFFGGTASANMSLASLSVSDDDNFVYVTGTDSSSPQLKILSFLNQDISNASDTVSIEVLESNNEPTLDAINNISIQEDAPEQTIVLTGITAGNSENQPLRVTATSSDTNLIPHPTVTYTTSNATASLAFTPAADEHGTATITVTVEAGGLDNDLLTAGDNTTFSESFDVTAASINDPPAGDVTIDGNATQPVVLSVNSSTLQDAEGLGAFVYQWLRDDISVSGANSPTYMLSQDDIDARISVRIDYTDNQGTAEHLTSEQTSKVLNVNEIPVLDPYTSPRLNLVVEDIGAPVGEVGTLVSEIVSTDVTGIAITDTNLQGGTLYYSTDAGVTWIDIGDVSDTSARLLYRDPQTRLAFKPPDNFSGIISDVITFKVWDGTMGHANSAADISTNLAVAGVYDMDTSSNITSRAIAISADGNTAYASRSSRLHIVDVSDFATPVSLSEHSNVGGTINDLVLSNDGDAAYVVGVNSLAIVDLINPPFLLPASLVSYGAGFNDIVLSGDENTAYITTNEGFLIADVSNPENPTLIGSLSVDSDRSDVRGNVYPSVFERVVISADGNTAYIAGEEGLYIVDLSDTANPTLLGHYSDRGRPLSSVALSEDEDIAYLVGNSKKLYSIDITDPVNPVLITSINLPTEPWPAMGGVNGSELLLSPDGATAYVTINGFETSEVDQGYIYAIDLNADTTLVPTVSDTLKMPYGGYNAVLAYERNVIFVAGGSSPSGHNNGFQIVNLAEEFSSLTTTVSVEVTSRNDDPTGIVIISGSVAEDEILTAINDLADVDGLGVISYQWSRNGVEISGATANTYVLVQEDVGTAITATASYTDNDGTLESVTSSSTSTIANVNDSPTGEVSIDGVLIENAVLLANTSTIQDEDGLGEFAYQWLRDGVPISGANSSTHTLTQVDVGTQISVRVDYTDNESTAESLTSNQTSAVVDLNAAPVLDPSAYPQLDSVIEDAGIPVGQVGTLVSDLIDAGGTHNNFSDADGDPPGIAITGLNLQGGDLYFTINDGASWEEISYASDTFATLLYADADTRLYVSTPSGSIGSINDGITFRAWDRVGGYENGMSGMNTQSTDSIVSLFETDGSAICSAISANGQYAYVGSTEFDGQFSRSLFQVVDLQNPEQPTIVGQYEEEAFTGAFKYVKSITLSHDERYAYVLESNYYGLLIIDIQNPANPTRVGWNNTPGYGVQSVLLSPDGHYAYVADGNAGLLIIDVQDPTQRPFLSRPSESVGQYDTAGSASAVALSSDGQYAYVADGSALLILDVANPANPVLVGEYDGSANHVALSSDGRYAYISYVSYAAGVGLSSGLQVLDILDPANPTIIASLDTADAATEVILSPNGDYAYVAVGNSGIQVIDIRDHAALKSVRMHSTQGEGQQISLSGDGRYAYVTVDSGLQIIDLHTPILNPQNPRFLKYVGGHDTTGYAYDVIRSRDGQYAYVADGASGLQILDVRNPESPTLAGGYDTTGMAISLSLSNDERYIYVADGVSGLQVIDVQDPNSPTLVGTYNTSGYAISVTLSDNEQYAYVAGSNAGLQIIDIQNPAFPTIVGDYNTSGRARDVLISSDGQYAYVADGDSGLQILDVLDPAKPTIIGEFDTTGSAYRVNLSVDGRYVFIADGASGLQVIDVQDPAFPTLAGGYDTSGTAVNVTLSDGGQYAYVADNDAGLQILDIQNPAFPTIVAGYDTTGSAREVVLSSDGQHAYVADAQSGLQIIDVVPSLTMSQLLVGSIDIGPEDSAASAVAISPDGQYAYVPFEGGPLGQNSGLQVVDLHNIASPSVVGGCTLSASRGMIPTDIAISPDGLHAYVTNYGGHLYVIDIQDPINPVNVGGVGVNNEARSVAISNDGQYAYVSDSLGLNVIDLSNPTSPAVAGVCDFDLDFGAVSVALSPDGRYVYAGNYIVDVQDPNQPVTTGVSYNGINGAFSSDGRHLYTWGPGFNVYEFSSSSGFATSVNSVAFQSDEDANFASDHKYAYVMTSDNGLQIIDLKNPAMPETLGGFGLSTPGMQWCFDITISPDRRYVFVTNLDKDLTIFPTFGRPSFSLSADYVSIRPVNPVNSTPTGSVAISGTAEEDQVLTATNDLADVDGLGLIAYQWSRDTNDISGATANTYTLTQADVGTAITVTAKYTDDNGTVESVVSNPTLTVLNVNDNPAGDVTIDGDPTQNVVLAANTSTIQDEDGLGVLVYQWLREGSPISGANSHSYRLTQDDVENQISVRIDYTDNQGTEEFLTSEQTSKVIDVDVMPVLDRSASLQLSSIIEDAGAPVGQVGTLVSDLIDVGGTHNNFSDADGDLPGIAITETNLQGGRLYYSTDDGETWADIGEPTVFIPRLLNADETTRLAYEPAPDYAGTIANLFSFKAWSRDDGFPNGSTVAVVDTPVLSNSISINGYIRDAVFSSNGSIAFVGGGSGLQSFEVSNALEPQSLSVLTTDSVSALTISSDDSKLFVQRADAVDIIDVADPANPVLFSSFSTEYAAGRGSIKLSSDETLLYVVNRLKGFSIFDITDLHNPSLITDYDISRHATTFSDLSFFDDDTVFLRGHYSENMGIYPVGWMFTEMIDVRNKETPVKQEFLRDTRTALYFTDESTALYLDDDISGALTIVSINGEEQPTITKPGGFFGNSALGLSKDFSQAYIAATYSSILDNQQHWESYVGIVDITALSAGSLTHLGGQWSFGGHATNLFDPKIFTTSDLSRFYVSAQVPAELQIYEILAGQSVGLSDHADVVSIDVQAVDLPPTLDPISSQVFDEDTQQVVSLTGISGDGGGALPVQITAVSSNTDLISAISLDHVPTESTGSLTLVPAENAHGNAEITVTVENGGADDDLATTSDNLTYTVTFDVTVTSINDPPSSTSWRPFGFTSHIDQGASIWVSTQYIADADGFDADALLLEWYLDDTLTIHTGNYLQGIDGPAFQGNVGKTFSCHVSYLDNEGHENSFVYGSWLVKDVDDEPKFFGSDNWPTINGVPVVGEELSIDEGGVYDSDVFGAFNYQWGRTFRHELIGEISEAILELPGKKQLVMGDSLSNRLTVISTENNNPTLWTTENFIELPIDIRKLEASADGSKLFVAGSSSLGSKIVVMDIRPSDFENWSILKVIETPSVVSNFTLNEEGSMLFAVYSSSADLSIYNVEDFDSTSWGLAKTIPDVFSQGATALSHNGSRLYAANGNHYLLSSLIVIDTGSNNIDDWDIIRSIGISEYTDSSIQNITVMPDAEHVLLNSQPGLTVVNVASEDPSSWSVVQQLEILGEPSSTTGSRVPIYLGEKTLIHDGARLLVPDTRSDRFVYVVDVSDASPNNWTTLGRIECSEYQKNGSHLSLNWETYNFKQVIASLDQRFLFFVHGSFIEVLDYDLLENTDFSAFQIIDGATQATYTPTEDDVGSRIAVEISYVDGGGFDNSFQTFVNPLIRSDYPPTIDLVSDATINEDGPEHVVSLTGITAGSSESQPLRVTAVSSNTDLIPDPTVAYSSSDSTGSLAFTPVADQHGTATMTVTVEDGGLDLDLDTAEDNASTSRTFDVVVTPVNDVPSLVSTTQFRTVEDATQQTIPLTEILAGGGESQSLRVMASSNNSLLISDLIVNYSSAESTGSISFSLVADQNGSATVTVTVEDGGFDNDFDTAEDNQIISHAIDVQVRAINDAPVLSQPSSGQVIEVVNDGAGLPYGAVGTLVSSLIDRGGPLSNFSDIDGDLPGIAIVGMNLQGGNLYYSKDNGNSWLDVGGVSDSSPLLLHSDNSTRIYYKPADDLTGPVQDIFTYRAWDRNYGTLGGVIDTPGSVRSVLLSADGSKIYAADASIGAYPDTQPGLRIIDLSDPGSETIVASLETVASNYHSAFSPDGETLYLTGQDTGLLIIDISNPLSPSLLSTFDTPGLATYITVSADGTKVFMTDGDWHSFPDAIGGLRIVDVTDSMNPVLLGEYNTTDGCRAVVLSPDESIAYVANEENGLQIFDVSDPSAPSLLGAFDTPGWACDITLSVEGTTAYLADGPSYLDIPDLQSGLQIIDVSDPVNPIFLGKVDTGHQSRSVSLSSDGQTAYVSDSRDGMLIVDVADPQSPVVLRTIDTVGWALAATLSQDGATAYISTGRFGIEIIDLTSSTAFSSETVDVGVSIQHAPVLDPSASPQFDSVLEDSGIPFGQVGTLVSDLIDIGGTHGNFSDTDGDLPGIAITRTDLQGGSLWYSKDDGLSWLDFGAVFDNSPRLLMADAVTRVYLQPAADFAGSLHDVFTFKAWDRFGAWRQLGSDLDGEGQYDNSGWSVSLSEDGRTVAIGARCNSENGDQAGHARVYRYDGSQWTQLGNDFDGDAALDMDGWSVSLAGSGNTVAIGSCFNDANGSESGRVRIYDWDGITWSQRGSSILGTNINDQLGRSVSLSSDGMTVGIGARLADGGGEESGAAIIYRWTGSDWNQLGSSINGSSAYDEAGSAVALSKDGLTIAVGAPLHDSNGGDSGQVRVFKWDGTVWQQLGLDLDGSNAGDQFGHALAVSEDGTTLAVGAIGSDGNGDKSGSTQVYRWDGLAWNQLGEKLVGRSPGVQFGYSVALSSDGNSLAVGAPDEAGSGHNWDPVRVFQWHDNEWAQTGNDILQESNDDRLGFSVSLSARGDYMAIGAIDNYGSFAGSGHTRIYEFAANPNNLSSESDTISIDVLEVISNQDSAILAKDSAGNLYVNTQPVIYQGQQVSQAFFGSSVVGADTSDSENALLLQPLGANAEEPPTHRLLTDETWRINGIFNSLQNASSPVLDLSGREVSGTLSIAAVAGAYEINGARNPTLIVRRGGIYNFNLNTAGHPFWLQTTGNGYQPENSYSKYFQGQGRTESEHLWVVPVDAPDEIFYQCEFHSVMFGKIIVVD